MHPTGISTAFAAESLGANGTPAEIPSLARVSRPDRRIITVEARPFDTYAEARTDETSLLQPSRIRILPHEGETMTEATTSLPSDAAPSAVSEKTAGPGGGRRVLVTGGSRGIGFAVAKRLAEEGYVVAVNGRNAESRGKALRARLRSLRAPL